MNTPNDERNAQDAAPDDTTQTSQEPAPLHVEPSDDPLEAVELPTADRLAAGELSVEVPVPVAQPEGDGPEGDDAEPQAMTSEDQMLAETSIGDPIPLDRTLLSNPRSSATATEAGTTATEAGTTATETGTTAETAIKARNAALANMTPYEFEVLAEVEEVKNPPVRWLSKLVNAAHEPIDKVGGAVLNTEVGSSLGDALGVVLQTLQDGATWSVREPAILRDFQRTGHAVADFSEIPSLPLESVDDVVGKLARKYRIAATVEGTLVGATGFAGLLADIPLIIGIALRGVTEFAAYYGFYPFDNAEKRFALELLSTAAAPSLKSRQESLAKLTYPSQRGEADGHGEDSSFASQAVERVLEGMLSRLARGKVAQAVPLVGAAIGGGFNRWFVAQVMSLAEALYRERFLIRLHKPEVRVEVKLFDDLAGADES